MDYPEIFDKNEKKNFDKKRKYSKTVEQIKPIKTIEFDHTTKYFPLNPIQPIEPIGQNRSIEPIQPISKNEFTYFGSCEYPENDDDEAIPYKVWGIPDKTYSNPFLLKEDGSMTRNQKLMINFCDFGPIC